MFHEKEYDVGVWYAEIFPLAFSVTKHIGQFSVGNVLLETATGPSARNFEFGETCRLWPLMVISMSCQLPSLYWITLTPFVLLMYATLIYNLH